MNTTVSVADRIASATVAATVAEVPQGRYWTSMAYHHDTKPFAAADWTVAIRDASAEEIGYLLERFCYIAFCESDYCYQTQKIEPVLYLGTSHQRWCELFRLAEGELGRTVSELVEQLTSAQQAREVAEDAQRKEENAQQDRVDEMLDREGVKTSSEFEVFKCLAGYSPGSIRIARRMVVQDAPRGGSLVWEANASKTTWLRAYAAKHGGLEAAKAAAKSAMESVGCDCSDHTLEGGW